MITHASQRFLTLAFIGDAFFFFVARANFSKWLRLRLFGWHVLRGGGAGEWWGCILEGTSCRRRVSAFPNPLAFSSALIRRNETYDANAWWKCKLLCCVAAFDSFLAKVLSRWSFFFLMENWNAVSFLWKQYIKVKIFAPGCEAKYKFSIFIFC